MLQTYLSIWMEFQNRKKAANIFFHVLNVIGMNEWLTKLVEQRAQKNK